jgi:hypothetical protein
MMVRPALLAVSLSLAALVPASAAGMSKEELRATFMGSTIKFNCLDRRSGVARYNADGTGTATVKTPTADGGFETEQVSGKVRATKKRGLCLKFEDDRGCFNVVQTGANTFRATLRTNSAFWCEITRT